MDNSFAGPMSMVKIDGAKIKQLREQQGLTQLYLATAVEVTTDTISRWENRRYPSIKRDNGLKLAEALNVQLEDLLEDELEESQSTESPALDLKEKHDIQETAGSGQRNNRRLIGIAATLLGLVLIIIWYLLQPATPGPFTAERIVPAHCISGQPFPVIIHVSGAPATALILKETIPDNSTVHATSPKVAAGGLKNNQIKWLKKIDGQSVFAYMISVSGKEEEIISLAGTAAISGGSESPIQGRSSSTISHFHWADTNMDNVISDDEILAVYDQYSEITDIDLDIDLIEEIWLGSEYRWDPDAARFKIIE